MAIYTLRTGATSHPEDSVLQFITDLIRTGGVLDLGTTNHFKVVQRGAGANMSIDISAGRCYIKGSSNAYPVRNTDAINVTITSNSSGNPRKDAIVAYIDLAETPTTTADDVVKTIAVAGTPAGSPSAPDDSSIQTAVGGSNPFLLLGYVTVANNETEITDAEIEDERVRIALRHSLRATTTSYSATLELNMGEYNDHLVELTGNITFSEPINTQVDVPFIIRPVQDSTGSRTIAWWSNIDWFGGTPTPTTTASKKDSYMFIKRANARYEGYILGQNANIT